MVKNIILYLGTCYNSCLCSMLSKWSEVSGQMFWWVSNTESFVHNQNPSMGNVQIRNIFLEQDYWIEIIVWYILSSILAVTKIRI